MLGPDRRFGLTPMDDESPNKEDEEPPTIPHPSTKRQDLAALDQATQQEEQQIVTLVETHMTHKARAQEWARQPILSSRTWCQGLLCLLRLDDQPSV